MKCSSLKLLAIAAFTLMALFVFQMSRHFHDEASSLGAKDKVSSAVKNQVTPSIGVEQSKGPLMEKPAETANDMIFVSDQKTTNPITQHRQDQNHDAIKMDPTGRHPILYLSDKEYKETSVAKLMSTYGEAEGTPSCPGDFGNKLVNRWREQKKTFCSPLGQNGDIGNHSSVECYHVKQTKHHGSGDNICVMRNVAVDLASQFDSDDDQVAGDVVKNYVTTRHAQQPYIHFKKGFVSTLYGCSADREYMKEKYHPGWNSDWTVNGLQTTSPTSPSECAVWVDHPVLIDQRDTFANFFHDSEDFVNVFLAMAILEWNFQNTQVLLTDLYPKGPFWPMWEKVFSGVNTPALDAWDIKKKFGRDGANKNMPKGKVCFKELAIGIYGPAAPITVASWNTPCRATALVKAYSDFVIRGLELQKLTHYQTHSDTPSNTITVTYMARRPSSEWPERKYCSDTNSFFLCGLWEHFGQRSLGRMIKNDAEVVTALKNLENLNRGDGKKVVVHNVDYNVLTFEEQIKIDLQTDIMIGPHGAGLMHNIFMRDRAALIELFIDGSAVNRHFHNLAHWYGRRYDGVPISNPIQIDRLVGIVQNAIESIDVKRY